LSLRSIPTPNDADAARFAKLFQSGTPAVAAIMQMFDVDDQLAHDIAMAWLSHPGVAEALLDLGGGRPFEDLNIAEQATQSVAKAHREMSWYLWSHHFAEVSGSEKATWKQAYENVTKWFPPTTEGAGSPLDQFWKSYGPKLKKQLDKMTDEEGEEQEH
jgi:hypothetical protein